MNKAIQLECKLDIEQLMDDRAKLKAYKQGNIDNWTNIRIGGFYKFSDRLYIRVLGKPEPEFADGEFFILNHDNHSYSYHASSGYKDYNWGAYNELTEEEYEKVTGMVIQGYSQLIGD